MLNIKNIIKESIEEELNNARSAVNTHPTDLQKKAGNYKMGHIIFAGFRITIENPKGSYREGMDDDGKRWRVPMRNDYGYFVHTKGKDGDPIDVFLGYNPYCDKVYVVDQNNRNGEFDESKVMLGFNLKEEAKEAYLSNYEDGWQGFRAITEVDIDEFREWLYDGKKQRKPFSEYSKFKKEKKYYELTESQIIKLISKSIKKALV